MSIHLVCHILTDERRRPQECPGVVIHLDDDARLPKKGEVHDLTDEDDETWRCRVTSVEKSEWEADTYIVQLAPLLRPAPEPAPEHTDAQLAAMDPGVFDIERIRAERDEHRNAAR